MIDIKDIYWLAGYLEGEGSFTIHKKGNYRQFRIEFSSTDFDIVKKVKLLLRAEQKISLRANTLTQLGNPRKQEYYLKIYNTLALQWMMTLYSLMGERRKSKIKDIIITWKNYIANGSGLCRKCKGPLQITVIKSGYNTGKRQTYCLHCRGN